MKALIVENFFDNFKNIKDNFKSIPLYDLKTFNKKFSDEVQNWPGKRSDNLSIRNPFLFNLIVKEMYEKFGKILPPHITMSAYIHLRLSKDKDWVHKDRNHDLSLLVYLSETNLNSGTCLYEEDDGPPSTTINFVQNRALLFDSNVLHKSLHNHGNDIDNGRLTLNCFIKNNG